MARRQQDIWVRGTRCQIELDEIVAADSVTAERHAELALTRSVIDAVLHEIPAKYAEIIRMHYGLTRFPAMSLSEIARVKRTSHSRIVCLHCIGITTFVAKQHGDRLRPHAIALGAASVPPLVVTPWETEPSAHADD